MVQKLSQWTTFLEKEFSIIAMLYVHMRNFIQLTKTKQTIFSYIFPQSVRRFSLEFSIFSTFYIDKLSVCNFEPEYLRRPNI